MDVDERIKEQMISNAKENEIEIMLRYPVAVQQDERISIGRRIANRWRLIGYGSVKSFS
jgi:translation initiation factor 2 subunit 3